MSLATVAMAAGLGSGCDASTRSHSERALAEPCQQVAIPWGTKLSQLGLQRGGRRDRRARSSGACRWTDEPDSAARHRQPPASSSSKATKSNPSRRSPPMRTIWRLGPTEPSLSSARRAASSGSTIARDGRPESSLSPRRFEASRASRSDRPARSLCAPRCRRRFHWAAPQRLSLSKPRSSEPARGPSRSPDGRGVAVTASSGTAELLVSSGARQTRRSAITGAVDGANLIGVTSQLACLRLETVAQRDEAIRVARRAVCVDLETGKTVLDRPLPPALRSIPRVRSSPLEAHRPSSSRCNPRLTRFSSNAAR